MPSGRLLRQVLSAIGRRPVAWVTAVLLAALGLGALGLAAISFWSLRPYVARAAIGPEASVLLAAHAPAAETEALRNSLEQLGTVASARFLSRDAALADLAARTPSDREAIDQLAVNPLPDAIVVTFRPWAAPDAIESTAAAIRKMPRVDAVELDVGWYRKVRALLRLVVPGAGFLGAAFLVHAVGWMLVAVTLSAPIDSGRVQLLWLLGADDRMIRRTPVAAGALTALVAAAVALLVTRAGWVWLDSELASIARLYAAQVRLRWPAPSWVAGFLGVATLAGALIGSVRARARLRAIRTGAAASTGY
jgi:cell division transport system permease protein